MPRTAPHPEDRLLSADEVAERCLGKRPQEITPQMDPHGFIADAHRWQGGRQGWLASGVAAYLRALPRENPGGLSPRALRAKSAKSSAADGAAA